MFLSEQILGHFLFKGLSHNVVNDLLNEISVKLSLFEKGEIISKSNTDSLKVGILLSGDAFYICDTSSGNRCILQKITANDTFGLSTYFATLSNDTIYLSANTTCEALLIPIKKLFHTCANSPETYNTMVQNALTLVANENIIYAKKLYYMSNNSIRNKIKTYLIEESICNHSNEIWIPFQRQELADYLCVDRSALSTELSKMKKEGLIDYQKNHFILHKTLH